MATQESLDLVQKIYIAYYGRPADPLGQSYWADAIDAANGDASAVINAFGTSAEATAIYGNLGPAAAVNNLYNQLFGRDADVAGLKYYVDGLSNGTFTLAGIALTIANGAQGSDVATLNAKIDAADAFTAAVDTTQEIIGYSGDTAAAAARALLATVVDSATSSSFIDTVGSSVADVVSGASSQGHDYVLTAGVDTFNGGSGKDTFKVWDGVGLGGSDLSLAKTVVGADDKIDGGNGVDTLNWTATVDHNNELVGSFTNIEIVNITGADNLGGKGAEIAAAQAAVDSAYSVADKAWTDVYGQGYGSYDGGAEQVRDVAQEYLDGAGVDANVTDMVNYLSHFALNSGDNTTADTVVYNAAVAAAGAAAATPSTVYAAIVGAMQNYIDAYNTAYSNVYDAIDTLDSISTGSSIDAAFFGGMTQLTHDAAVLDTINLASNQTLILTASTLNGDVQLKDGETTANIVLKGLHADDLDIWNDDSALTTVNVTSDTIETLSLWTYSADKINLHINSDAVIDLDDVDTDVAAAVVADGTGNLTINVNDQDVASVTTAGGNDTINWDVSGIANDLAISTGAGNDSVNFNLDGGVAGVVTVDLGTGNDRLDISNTWDGESYGGDGLYITEFKADQDHFNGGDGIDELVILSGGTMVKEEYDHLNLDVSNFESLRIMTDGEDNIVDASRLAEYKTITFDGAWDQNSATVTGVAADQTVRAVNFDYYLTVEAAGYTEGTSMGGDLHVVVGEANQHDDYSIAEELYVYGDNVTIDMVGATVDDDHTFQSAADEIYGDASTLTINFSNDGLYAYDNGSSDQYATVNASDEDFANLESVTFTSTGGVQEAEVYNSEGSALATIDASGLSFALHVDANDSTGAISEDNVGSYQNYYYGDAEEYFTSFYYEGTNASVAETIKLNASTTEVSNDYLYWADNSDGVAGSNVNDVDTVTGFNTAVDFVDYNDYTFYVAGATGGEYADVKINEALSLRANLEALAAINTDNGDVGVADNAGFVFEYKGATYLFFDNAYDNGTSTEYNTVTDNDFLVKLVGVTGANADSTFFFNGDVAIA